MTSELLDLALIDKADVQNEDPKWPAYKKYFMHGTSHHMGLDTHDLGAIRNACDRTIWCLLSSQGFISLKKKWALDWKTMWSFKPMAHL